MGVAVCTDTTNYLPRAYVASNGIHEVSLYVNLEGNQQRESDILKALAEGLSNKQIARQFWLSEQTIKFHLTNIYRKLEVGSRTEAVRHAYEHGMIENPMLRATAESA